MNKLNEIVDSDILKKVNFINDSFENINLEGIKVNLINSFHSIEFCNKDKFYSLWNNLSSAINKDGFFIGSFLGNNDSWNIPTSTMTFLDKEEVQGLFKSYQILRFTEMEKEGHDFLGNQKFWHVFHVIARKK